MLRTWHPVTGTPMVSLGDLLFKFMGVSTVGWSTTGSQKSGTIVDDRFTNFPGCVPFAFAVDASIDTNGRGLRLSISGNTLTWTFTMDPDTAVNRPDTTFAYGIY